MSDPTPSSSTSSLPANPTPAQLPDVRWKPPPQPLALPRLNPRGIDRTYHPQGGLGMSPSLIRARKPYRLVNIILGTGVACFTVGIYAYAISAVQQDDFSDVTDLLPPPAERSQILSIEDELLAKSKRDANNRKTFASADPILSPLPDSTSSPSATSNPTKFNDHARGGTEGGVPDGKGGRRPMEAWGYGLGRLGDSEFVKKRGWVEKGSGNLLVWGAPDVERLGRVGDVEGKGDRKLI